MWVYMTRGHDTATTIASRFAGAGSSKLAKMIRRANAESSANLLMPGNYYAPGRAVVVPNSLELTDPFKREFHQRVLSELDSLMPDERAGLARLIRGGQNINALAHAARMTVKADEILAEPKHSESWWSTTKEWFEDALDFRSRGVDQFLERVTDYKGALNALKDAVEHNGDIEAARAKAKMIYGDMLHHFHKEVSEYKVVDEGSYFDSLKRMGKELVNDFIPIDNEEKLANLMKVGRSLRFVSHSLFWLNIYMDMFETYEAYEHHGPWIKMAIADALEVGAAVVSTALIGMVIISTGGLAVVGSATADTVANYYIDKGIHKLVGLDNNA